MPSKYGNKKTRGYASKREANRMQDLALLQMAGKISGLKEQVKFELTPKYHDEQASYYIADATYTEDGKFVVEDCKGARTPLYILKRKMMRFRYGIIIRET